jgi:hypothetical protein
LTASHADSTSEYGEVISGIPPLTLPAYFCASIAHKRLDRFCYIQNLESIYHRTVLDEYESCSSKNKAFWMVPDIQNGNYGSNDSEYISVINVDHHK